MRNTIYKYFILSFLILVQVPSVNATWYYPHTVNYAASNFGVFLPSMNGGGPNRGTSCDNDGDTTGGSPDEWGYGAKDYRVVSSPLTNGNLTSNNVGAGAGSMTCEWWDGYAPLASNNITTLGNDYYITGQQGWTNVLTQSVHISLNDAGGSRLGYFEVQWSTASDTPGFTSWSARSTGSTVGNWTGNVGNPTFTGPNTYTNIYNFTATNRTAYKFRVHVCDGALNCTDGPESSILRIDTDIPVAGDVINVTNSGADLLAIDNLPMTVKWGINLGSPIKLIKGQFENITTNNSFNPDKLSDSDLNSLTKDELKTIEDISKVDPNRVDANPHGGSREYSYKINQVCDLAGNCSPTTSASPLATYKLYSYANTTLMTGGSSSNIVTTNELTASSNIANGVTKNVGILLKDTYGNQVVPASGINRTIDFNWNITNSMFLNQHDRTGGDSVFVDRTTEAGNYLNRLTNSTSFNSEISSDGNYKYGFKVYTPTSNQDNGPVSDIDAKFNINSITFDVNGIIGARTLVMVNSSNIVSKFSPLYYTKITGDINAGLINNAIQESTISILKNSSVSTDNTPDLKLDFGGLDSSKFNAWHTLSSSCTDATTPITTLTSSSNSATFPSSPGTFNFCTKINQKPGVVVGATMKTYLSTHISYTLDSHTVLYNSDIVGQNSFTEPGTITSTTVQAGIKTTGISSSSKASQVISGQASNDIMYVGDNSKTGNGALFLNQKVTNKTAIRSNAIDFAKSITSVNNGGNSITNLTPTGNSDGYTMDYGTNGSVLYFKNPNSGSGIVTLGSAGGANPISGKRTILIIGGNLYIRSNLYYNNIKNDILGVIVLKNEAGVGGNIYIDPSITNLAGTFYADQSIISYNGSELGAGTNISTLKNQLYINGNVISENTLGGATQNPAKCPAYITSCTNPQKYDLNFLRRYYIVPSGYTTGAGCPFSLGKVSGGGTPQCPGANYIAGSLENLVPHPIKDNFDKYYKYPLVIDYNSRILSSPPPLFIVN